MKAKGCSYQPFLHFSHVACVLNEANAGKEEYQSKNSVDY